MRHPPDASAGVLPVPADTIRVRGQPAHPTFRSDEMTDQTQWGFETRQIHAGQVADSATSQVGRVRGR